MKKDEDNFIFKLDPKYTKSEVLENVQNCNYIEKLSLRIEENQFDNSWVSIIKN